MVQAQLMIFIKSNGIVYGIFYFVFARSCLPSMQELSPHALYMRLKRLCGRTAAGKLQVPESIHNQWLTGSRDELLLALTRSLKTHGFDPSARTRNLVRVGWANTLFQSCFSLGAIVKSVVHMRSEWTRKVRARGKTKVAGTQHIVRCWNHLKKIAPVK